MTVLGAVRGVMAPTVLTAVVLVGVKVQSVGSTFSNLGQPARLGRGPEEDCSRHRSRDSSDHAGRMAPEARGQSRGGSPQHAR